MSASETTSNTHPFPRAPGPPRSRLDNAALRTWLAESQGSVSGRLAANYACPSGPGPRTMAAEPYATTPKGTPSFLSPRSMSIANSADVSNAPHSHCSSDVPSLASCTTDSSGSSVGTSEASAVSGIPLSDPEEGHIVVRPRARLECPFHFLNCDATFEDLQEWKIHSKGHWHGEKPPKKVACPLCPFIRTYREGDEAWDVRMRHVAHHHIMGYSLAASRPDFDLYEYMHKKNLLSSTDYKSLVTTGSGAEHALVATTTHDSRRRR